MKRQRVENRFDSLNYETRELTPRVTCCRHSFVRDTPTRRKLSSRAGRKEETKSERNCQTKAYATAPVQVLSIIECTRYRDKGLVTRSSIDENRLIPRDDRSAFAETPVVVPNFSVAESPAGEIERAKQRKIKVVEK